MNKTFSIYLDLVRFLAAVVVFLGHASYSRFAGGARILWVLEALGADTVMVFFVLSGVVIAYVADKKEKTLEEYGISRLARLYSVVVPALLLTIVLDSLGPHIADDVYDGSWFTTSDPLWRFFANLFFLHELWFFSVEAFSNWPFWSLGYEFWYYAIFGVAFYVRSPARYYLVVLGCLLVGPKILLLFPVWLLGVWVYFKNKNNPVGEPLGWVFMIGPLVLYALFRGHGGPDWLQSWAEDAFAYLFANAHLKWSTYFLSRYVTGMLIALHFIGIAAVAHRFENILGRFEKSIRYVSGYTFSLYLFHYPMLYFFSAVASKFVDPPLRSLFSMLSTVALVWMLGTVTEGNKAGVKRFIVSWRSKTLLLGNILRQAMAAAVAAIKPIPLYRLLGWRNGILDGQPVSVALALAQDGHRVALASRQHYLVLLKAAMVGVVSGGLAIAFHLCLDFGHDSRNQLIGYVHEQGGPGMAIVVGFSTIMVIIAAFVAKRFTPEIGGSGILHVKAVLQGYRTFRWFRMLVVKFASGLIGISGGLVLGREGPIMLMGAAVGEGWASLPQTRQNERRTLVAAGGGAGLSAAFNSPLAGIAFVFEELQWRFASLEFFAATLACLVAALVCRAVLGQFSVFQVTLLETPDLTLLLAFISLGGLSGLFGVVFNKALLAAQKLSAFSTRFRRVAWWLLCGMAVGATGWLAPHLIGGGQRFLDRLLNDDSGIALSSIPLFFGVRFLLTIASYGTGAAGGIVSPVLVLGALLGLLFANALQMLFPQLPLEPTAFAVVGMGAYFTAVVRTPLTGIVLMVEMTGNCALILPLLAACYAALLVAKALHALPIYQALLECDLQKQQAKSGMAKPGS